jgi:Iap family predicted aminopeptidase
MVTCVSYNIVTQLESSTLTKRGEILTSLLDEHKIPYKLQRVQRDDEESDNIIVSKEGNNPRRLIIRAHYDPYPGSGGANDNGSGVSVLYELINHFFSHELELTLDFIFFTWEETGRRGSQYYTSTLTDRDNILGMINLDMCGTGEMVIFDHKNQPESLLPRTCRNVCEKLAVPYHSMVRLPPSDDCEFEKAGIASISLAIIPPEYQMFVERLGKATHPMTSAWTKMRNLPILVPTMTKESQFIKVMHKPTDTADKVSESSLRRIYDVAAAMIVHLNQYLVQHN